ncbi:Spc98 family-domain-containing protein [Syncephalastrum racemosum]|uniref:Spindle pole body component n=1 Tax=Syncephalastrum racemosum TaxID=13706 RepID=A0A1X2HS99_SYNRA|nr:Spc98 family-domain-containing protein [Syncephalastrum racemosum]
MLQTFSSNECTLKVAPWTEGLLRGHHDLRDSIEQSRDTVDPLFQSEFRTPLRVSALGDRPSPVSIIDRVTEGSTAPQVQTPPRQTLRPEPTVQTWNTDHDLLWEQHDSLEQPAAPVFSWDGPLQPGDTPTLSTLSARVHEDEYQAFMPSRTPFKEDIIAEHVLAALLGHPSVSFQWNSAILAFEKRIPDIRILGTSAAALRVPIEELLLLATRMRRLTYLIQVCKHRPSQFGLTGLAFACSMEELLLRIRHTVFKQFRNHQPLTILQVYQHTQGIAMVHERIARLFSFDDPATQPDEERFRVPFGADLLQLLYNETQSYDWAVAGIPVFYRDTCLTLFCQSSMPYLDMLSQWIGLDANPNRTLDASDPFLDPHLEFFVRQVRSHSRHQSMLSVWTDSNLSDAPTESHYRRRKEAHLPFQLSQAQADMILRAGNALQLLKRYKPNHPLCDIRSWCGHSDIKLRWLLADIDYKTYTDQLNSVVQVVQRFNGELPCTPRSIPPPPSTTQPVNFAAFTEPGSGDAFSIQYAKLQDYHRHTAESNPDFYIPSLSTVVEQSIHAPLATWCPLVNRSALHLYFEQFKIKGHLSLLHDFFLFGNPVFVAGLTQGLFQETVPDTWPPHVADLSLALRAVILEALSQMPEDQREVMSHIGLEDTVDIDNLITFGVRETTRTSAWCDPTAVEALDFLYLGYHVQRPLHIVITRRVLERYNRLFTFLLQIARVKNALKQTYRTHLEKAHPTRFAMEHFMASLTHYVTDTAIGATWHTFMARLDDTNGTFFMDPVSLGEYHEHILDRMLFQCFLKQNQRHIRSMVRALLSDILDFVRAVEAGRPVDATSEAFHEHANQFSQVLRKLHQRGIGRLGNVMNSLHDQSYAGLLGDWHERAEAKSGQGTFVQDLLTRLNMNGFYKE